MKDTLDDCIRIFQDGGYAVNIYRTESKEFLERQFYEEYDCVIAAGGDGTVNTVINAMLRYGSVCPLGILPSGVANDFATYLKTPTEPILAAQALMNGKTALCDIGRANDTHFINVCASGLLTNVSTMVDRGVKDVLGKFAYYIKGLGQIPNFTPISARIETSQQTIQEDIYLFLILNSSGVGGFEHLCPKASIYDGQFDFVALRAKPKPLMEIASLLPKIFKGDLLEDDSILYLRDSHFRIVYLNDSFHETDLDGEVGPDMPIEVVNLPKSFPIIIPEPITEDEK